MATKLNENTISASGCSSRWPPWSRQAAMRGGQMDNRVKRLEETQPQQQEQQKEFQQETKNTLQKVLQKLNQQ